MKKRLTRAVWLIPLFSFFLMGQTTSSCSQTDTRPTVKMVDGTSFKFYEDPETWTRDNPKVAMAQVCTHTDKAVCEWLTHPSNTQAFEMYGPTVGSRPLLDGHESETSQIVRCGAGETARGICEDWSTIHGTNLTYYPDAVSMFDIGTCSISLPTNLVLKIFGDRFQKQSDERLGEQRPPGSQDVVLWLDFVLGLKDSPEPFRIWTDWTKGPNTAVTKDEVIIEAMYRVDGDIAWNFDPEWLGNGDAGAILSSSIETWMWTFGWPAIFFGDCERDRNMRVQFRAEFAASGDGGMGLKVNRTATCGPNGASPCTWASIQEWPARPICNNQVKPKIENEFIDNLVLGLYDFATNTPRDLTLDKSGESILPFKLNNGERIPIERVVLMPNQVHFVFIDDLLNSPYASNYNELYAKNLCNQSRTVTTAPVKTQKGGWYP